MNHIVTLYNVCLRDQVAKYTEWGHSAMCLWDQIYSLQLNSGVVYANNEESVVTGPSKPHCNTLQHVSVGSNILT